MSVRLALVYLLTAIVAGAGFWFLALGITSAASPAEYPLAPPANSLGESLRRLLLTIVAAIVVAAIAWPVFLRHARRGSWLFPAFTTGVDATDFCGRESEGPNSTKESAFDLDHSAFNRVVSSLLEGGLAPQEMITVVTAAAAKSTAPTTSVLSPVGYVALYQVVPPDLMTVSEVAENIKLPGSRSLAGSGPDTSTKLVFSAVLDPVSAT